MPIKYSERDEVLKEITATLQQGDKTFLASKKSKFKRLVAKRKDIIDSLRTLLQAVSYSEVQFDFIKYIKMSKQELKRTMRKRIFCRIYKTISIILLIIFYRITIHQYLSSYTYANLKYTLHKWSKHFNVDGRISLCLLQNPFSSKIALNYTSCFSCETIKEISQVYQTSFDEIELICIHQNKPVLVTDVMFEWPKFARMNENILEEITEVWKHPSSRNIQPCYYATSIRQAYSIVDYWKIVSNPLAGNWFFTWKNCNLKATKYFRHLYHQPYFVKYFLPAAQVNWVIISSNFESSTYKQLPLQSNKLLVLMQLKGALHYRLQVQSNCNHLCSDIEGILKKTQTLVFNSDMWEFYYLPRREEIDISVMLEYEI